MDTRREEELLLHIAAGTDPLTALAALPREDESSVESRIKSSRRGIIGWIAFGALIGFMALLLLR